VGHKEPAQQSQYRNGGLDDCKGEGEYAATEMAWNYLRCVSVECNQLRADGIASISRTASIAMAEFCMAITTVAAA